MCKSSQIWIIFTFLTVQSGIFFSCSHQARDTAKTVFKYNESGGISSLDPIYTRNQENIWAVSQLYSRLFRFNGKTELEGDLATHWEYKSGAWHIDIRDGVRWHQHSDWEPTDPFLRAQDVVFSLERLRNPVMASPGAWVLDGVEEEGIWALDSNTVVIQTKGYHPAFLSLLAMNYCAVVPQAYVEQVGKHIAEAPIGSGPFQFFLWRRNAGLVFHRNPHYYETDSAGLSLPYLDAVQVSFVRDPMSAMRELAKGNLNLISGVNGELMQWADGDAGITMVKLPYLKTDYIGMNTESSKKALRNPWFRKALNAGLDKNKMVEFLRKGIGMSAWGSMVPPALYPLDTRLEGKFSMDSARAYLNRVPEDDWKGVNFELATTAAYTQLCEWIQSEWQKLGLQIVVNVLPSSVHRQRVAEGQVDLFRKSWIADYPHPENFYTLFSTSQKAPQGPNYSRFSNPEFEQAYNALFAPEQNDSIYLKMEAILQREMPVVPLFYDQVVRCVSKGVSGMPVNALNDLDLRTVRMAPNL